MFSNAYDLCQKPIINSLKLLISFKYSFVANFDDFEMPVIVDYSTNVGEVVYTLINQNDPVDVEIEDNPYFELNPSNDRKY